MKRENVINDFVRKLDNRSLKLCVKEIYVFQDTGYLADGTVRKFIMQLVNELDLSYQETFETFILSCLQIAAYKWVEIKGF